MPPHSTDPISWTETLGGPHLLIPEELWPLWQGGESTRDLSDPKDQSDYARACRVNDWIGTIPCGDGQALVLSGDFGSVAWFGRPDRQGGVLVQCLFADSEAEVIAAIESGEALLSGEVEEELAVETDMSGQLRLVDSVDNGRDPMLPSQVIRLEPGRYLISASRFETSTMTLVLRQLSPL